MNGPLVLLLVVEELGHIQDLKHPLHLMAVLHVLAQEQRQYHVILMHAKVVKY